MSYDAVLRRVGEAANRAGKDITEIVVVAVSKSRTPAEILALYELGHRDFGENRAQELVDKAGELPGDIRWHFVGSLQSRKARIVRPVVALLHSMDRASLGSAWLKGHGIPPPALLQVNIGHESQKSGIAPEDMGQALDWMSNLGLEANGLMAIPPVPETPENSRQHFARLRNLRERFVHQHPSLKELSMGMSDDFEVAIEERASIIRVGRAIFDKRN